MTYRSKQHNTHFLLLNLSNAARLGQMKHGDFFSMGVGKDILEIQCYSMPDNQQWLHYDVTVTRLGEIRSNLTYISFAHLMLVYTDCAYHDFRFDLTD